MLGFLSNKNKVKLNRHNFLPFQCLIGPDLLGVAVDNKDFDKNICAVSNIKIRWMQFDINGISC